MAHHGFCSNEKILKSALKKYQNNPHFGFTPQLMYLEEYLQYVVEHEMEISVTQVVVLALDDFVRLKDSERKRYEDLADEANSYIFG